MIIKLLIEKAKVVREAIVGKKTIQTEKDRIDSLELNDRIREVDKYVRQMHMDDFERRHPTSLL